MHRSQPWQLWEPYRMPLVKIREVIFKDDLKDEDDSRRIIQKATSTDLQTKTTRPTKPYLGHLSKLWKVHRTWFMTGDFSHPDFFGENSTAAHMLSIKFLECLGGLLPRTNVKDVPSSNEALLDSEIEKTCFEIPWSVTALAIVVRVL